jgi:wyosine [tRNA(Phe)-imidazoG37] synthetase (radical SAM superfamily)
VPRPPRRQYSSKYTYGPVPSRRLGHSLGVDIIPHKNCSFDCVYCQLGRTTCKTLDRKEYAPARDILSEIEQILKREETIDYITFSGSGEPTLHLRIGHLIDELKKLTSIPIAVLTNGSLLHMSEVRNDLLHADVVLPTLCATNQDVFEKVNRGHTDLRIETIIQGLIDFRKVFKGKIWLELMFVKGLNDMPDEINRLQKKIEKIKPDIIHLNTVVRPPSEDYAEALSFKDLERIKQIIGERAQIIADFHTDARLSKITDRSAHVLSMIKRRPVTLDDIVNVIGLSKNEILKIVVQLEDQGEIQSSKQGEKTYYQFIKEHHDQT